MEREHAILICDIPFVLDTIRLVQDSIVKTQLYYPVPREHAC